MDTQVIVIPNALKLERIFNEVATAETVRESLRRHVLPSAGTESSPQGVAFMIALAFSDFFEHASGVAVTMFESVRTDLATRLIAAITDDEGYQRQIMDLLQTSPAFA